MERPNGAAPGDGLDVLIVEDDEIATAMIRAALDEAFARCAVRVAATIEEARRAIARTPPALLLLDLGLPDGDGAALIDAARAARPGVRVVVLTLESGEERIARILRKGVEGFLLKEEVAAELPRLLQQLAQGRPPVSPSVSATLLAMVAKDGEAHELLDRLTEREDEVFRHLAGGLSRAEIGRRLGVSEHTVATHAKSLYRKLGVASRAEIGAFAQRHGITAPR